MPFEPIDNYAMIGDMHTVALVSVKGSIDWMCMPRFDGPSVFAAMLDDQKGGFFRIAPEKDDVTYKQFYWPGTNVLITRFLSEHGAAELADFMPVGHDGKSGRRPRELVRRITMSRGEITFEMECRPAFNFARDSHTVKLEKGGAIFRSTDLDLGLATETPLEVVEDGVRARFTLREGETAVFVLRQRSSNQDCGAALSEEACETAFRETVNYWREWISQSTYRGRWRDIVERSALALKLMTYEPTGAIVAAPTCSLPELVGGERNWDYRYTWIRDSAFTVYSFLRIGFTEEAANFLRFVMGLCDKPNPDGSLQIMYGIDGRKHMNEEMLDHLSGYRGSRPVRVGNDAHKQFQLDIYGELLDAIYLYDKYGEPISYDLWRTVTQLVDWVCANWHRDDDGIWEVRGGSQQFTYSKLMCWVAIDRALKISMNRAFPCDRQRWTAVRDRIYQAIMEQGWNEDLQAFVQSFGGDTLDAANLMMVLTLFVSPVDPRMLSTLEAILKPPEDGGLVADHLVYRYNVSQTDDGLAGSESTFNICTFWLVEALTRAGRFEQHRLEEGRLMFERMLGFANHVGLYAEETAMNGEGLGNFPQAFTHLALISAAVNLNAALGDRP
ncbi:MAG: glycoside hydrolase family 15 protein [Pseudomonadota bacterium]